LVKVDGFVHFLAIGKVFPARSPNGTGINTNHFQPCSAIFLPKVCAFRRAISVEKDILLNGCGYDVKKRVNDSKIKFSGTSTLHQTSSSLYINSTSVKCAFYSTPLFVDS